MQRPRPTWKQVERGLLRSMLHYRSTLKRIEDVVDEEAIAEVSKKTDELIDRSTRESGAQYLRTQDEITKLFAKHEALSKRLFKGEGE